MPTLEDAIALAAKAHAGATDKGRRPYVLHPLRVMLRFHAEVEMMTAVLHDVVEDTDVTLDQLKKQGYPKQVLEALDCLTRRKDHETWGEFIERVCANPIATRVKLADLEDNMDVRRLNRVGAEEAERLARYRKAWGWLQQVEERRQGCQH